MSISRPFITILFLLLLTLLPAQVPFAFRYQASVRNEQNKPVHDEVTFEINLFDDADAVNEIYSEEHTLKPDTNGLVAFSIGEGLTSDDFATVVWAEGPYYIQVILDGEEISYSQLVSVPYAMHAQTASKIHDLQEPVSPDDPTTKSYVDAASLALTDTLTKTINATNLSTTDSLLRALEAVNLALIDSLSKALAVALEESKSYSDSLAIAPKDLEVASSGDTLVIGNQRLLIPGMSSDNMPKYNTQLLLGGSYQESLTTAFTCNDSTYLLLGTTHSGNGDVSGFHGEADVWLVKLSKSLEVEWTKTLGGSAYDNGVVVLEEADSYVIGATTESGDGDVTSTNGEFDIWLFKVNKSGELIWEKSFGGAGTEFVNSVLSNGNGGYYIGATTFSNGGDISYLSGESDIWVFELDDDLNMVKSQTLGGSSFDALHSMLVASDESGAHLQLFATSSSNDGDIVNNKGALDFVSVALDQDLEVLSNTCYGTMDNEQLTKVQVEDNYTIMAGALFDDNWSVGSGNQLKNIYVEKIGSAAFSKTFGGSGSDVFVDFSVRNDTITILAQTSSQDGDVAVSKGGSDVWLFQLSPDGSMLNSKVYGGIYDETPKVLASLPNGGWLIGAESESSDADLSINAGGKDVWLLMLDRNLNLKWQKSYGGSYTECLTDVKVLDNDNFIIWATTSSNDYSIDGLHDKEGKSADIWILKTEKE